MTFLFGKRSESLEEFDYQLFIDGVRSLPTHIRSEWWSRGHLILRSPCSKMSRLKYYKTENGLKDQYNVNM